MKSKSMINLSPEAHSGLNKLSNDIKYLANRKIKPKQTRTTQFSFSGVVAICLGVTAITITIKVVLWIWGL